ncbi:MAG: hypothetical protein P8100_10765 [bacterium]
MKRILLFVSVLISYHISPCQVADWYIYEVDSIIDIALPGTVYEEEDTIINGIKTYLLYSNIDNSSFIVQKYLIEEIQKKDYLSTLPYDLNSLNKIYDGYCRGVSDATQLEIGKQEAVRIDEYHGYYFTLNDADKSQYAGCMLLLFNNYLYSFLYFNVVDFNTSDVEFFVNSIAVNPEVKITQFAGMSRSYKIGYFIGSHFIEIILFILVILFAIKYLKKKPKYNTRLKRN